MPDWKPSETELAVMDAMRNHSGGLGNENPSVTELAVIEAMRNHPGGLGRPLTGEEKRRIIDGPPERGPVNTSPIDGDKFLEAFRASLERHPIEWILDRTETKSGESDDSDETDSPVDDGAIDAFKAALDRHPIEWILDDDAARDGDGRPFDGEKFLEGCRLSLRKHSAKWLSGRFGSE